MKSKLAKYAGAIACALVVTASVLGTTVFADQTVNIIVNGRQVLSDVAPRIINGRVMVPISFIARGLGADVKWDNDTKTVSVQTKSEDVFDQQITGIDEALYIYARNTVTDFISKHDNRDQTGRELVTEDYDSDVPGYTPDVIIPIGGYPSTIDYEVVDAKFVPEDGGWVMRMNIYEWYTVAPEFGVQKLTVDFHLSSHDKIKAAWLVGEPEILEEYTVFPGLTVQKKSSG